MSILKIWARTSSSIGTARLNKWGPYIKRAITREMTIGAAIGMAACIRVNLLPRCRFSLLFVLPTVPMILVIIILAIPGPVRVFHKKAFCAFTRLYRMTHHSSIRASLDSEI